MSSLPNPLQGVNAQNPLGWPGATGTNMPPSSAPSVPGSPSLFGSPAPPNLNGTPTGVGSGPNTGSTMNPFGLSNPAQATNIARNSQLENLMTGEARNQLIPWFTQMMSGTAGPAADFFKTLMNLGSPYYQQQQRASFEQGTQQAQNTAAQSKDQLNAAGYGAAPSGLQAASIGQQAQGESQNLSQLFLQNLFQNENLQMQAGSALAQMAQMFNPAQLTSQGTSTSYQTQPTFAQQFGQIMSGIGGLFGSKGVPTGGNN